MIRKFSMSCVLATAALIFGCTVVPIPTVQEVAFSALTADGSPGTVTTTSLTLGFSADPGTLSLSDISLTGASKVALSGSGTTRSLTIGTITVTDGSPVTVTIANPGGLAITPHSRDVVVHVAAVVPPAAVASISLGSQTGTLTAAVAGSASYPVSTANIAEGSAGSIAWYTSVSGASTAAAPTGITASVSPIVGNAATITMAATSASLAGTYYFTLTEGATVSAVQTLVVSSGAVTVTVASQVGAIFAKEAGSATYAVTTANVADAVVGAITWCNASGTTPASTPAGISVAVTAVSANASTITVSADATQVAGSYYFKLGVAGASSAVKTLAVSWPTVSVGSQSSAVVTGTGGTATFAVTTSHVADGTAGSITFYTTSGGTTVDPTHAGITASVSLLSGNSAVVTVSASAAVAAKDYYFQLTEGVASSSVKTFTVSPVPYVTLNSQTGSIIAGTAGSATYSVFTNSGYSTVGSFSWWDASGTTPLTAPTGITASVSPVGAGGGAQVTMTASASALVGTYYFKLTEGATVSALCTLVVDAPPSVTVGPQDKVIYTGSSTFTTYTVTTTSIPNNTRGTVTWYTDASGSTTTSAPANIGTVTVNLTSGNAATVVMHTNPSMLAGTYYFKVTEVSAVSAVATFTITLATPSISVVFQSGATPKMYVYGSGVYGATGFDIYRSTVSGVQGSVYTSIGTTLGYYDSGISSGTSYYYTAVAKDASGHFSAPSVQVGASFP